MRLSICITTINAVDSLKLCLQALWHSKVKPYQVVVSDDSLLPEIQQQNRHIVEQYPQTNYVIGPRLGVCANRNSALNRLPSRSDFIIFIDDDICVAADFIANAVSRYKTMTPKERQLTLLTGGMPTKLSFRGYFCPSDFPLCVDLHTAVFPATFFEIEQWDENIFFGYEDALLSLRAIKKGYSILHCPELKVIDTRLGKSTLNLDSIGKLTKYDIYTESARLYVGIERYKNLYPSHLKLILFLIVYFIHMYVYLLKKQALSAWSKILHYSHIKQFF